MDHSLRLRLLRSQLEANGLDFLLVTHLPNIRYLCGFTGSAAALLVSHRAAALFTDGRYTAQAKNEVKGARVAIAAKAPLLAAAEWLTKSGKNSRELAVGIESESITVGMRDRLASALKPGGGDRSGATLKVRLRPVPPMIERARMVKDTAEIALLRQAAELGASLFPIACKNIRPGVTEMEVAAAMEYEARAAGADGMSFPTILASGPRSAVVHGRAAAARIPRRGFVVCDFGVILAGYCSDRTRTVHVGRPPQQARRMYDAVLEAQFAAIAAVRPGVTAGDVDGAARRVLAKHKLAAYFTHSTGHGLGLEIHEAPRLAAGQTQVLEPGMVITIEPGAYIPGKYGVRIEDVVVVTAPGCEVLTPTNRDLVVL